MQDIFAPSALNHPDRDLVIRIIKCALELSSKYNKLETGLPPIKKQDLENIVRYTLADRLNKDLQARFSDLSLDQLKVALAILTNGDAAPRFQEATGADEAVGADIAPPASIVPKRKGKK